MTYVYIDESGDLGFSRKGSQYFIISCVKINDEKINQQFIRIPKKIRQRTLSKKSKKQAELKFTNSSPLIRERFLSRAAKLDLEIYAVVIKKEYTKKTLQENLPILYNYLLKILLEKPLEKTKYSEKLHICLDKCISSAQRQNFESYIKTEFLSIFKHLPEIRIVHENSQSNAGLQVTDFVCGSFGYKYNTCGLKGECLRYTTIINNKIVIEKNDLFKKG